MNEKSRVITKGFLEKHFCLPKEYELLERINSGSKIAKNQLLIQYMPRLLEIAEGLAKHFEDRQEAMQVVMESFLKGLRILAYRYYCKKHEEQDHLAVWSLHIMEVYLRRIKEQILFYVRPNKEKSYLQSFNRVQLARLNKLNDTLKLEQQKIWGKISDYIYPLEIEKKMKDTDYSIRVSLDFYLLKSIYSIHSQIFSSNILGIIGLKERFNTPEFDWWTEGMPVLDDPYCYLLSELFEQWLIMHRIPDIALISTSIQIDCKNLSQI
ncbi:hypothetical protein [Albibacterium sp.]|uniref:hypothetical protein n=1 Tax=Albibacterium sp. TaxID=2952885 RepID=UPI002C29360B|nr:hypothetical protein [Albibacterium sp.]HUH18039.1 hypothetical protein [Albibacterium sp.]